MKRAAGLPVFSAFLAAGILAGCGDDEAPDYLPNTSPQNVLENLVRAYNRRDAGAYEQLLADDFRFFPFSLRASPFAVGWSRDRDLTATRAMFESPEVLAIATDLTFGPPIPVNETGRESWMRIDAVDVLLEVDLADPPGGGRETRIRLDGHQHRFHFRTGRNPAATEAVSPTSGRYYLVEWWDRGKPAETDWGPDTWGSVKARFLSGGGG